MNAFEKFLVGFKATMQTPTNYGWFHLMFVAIAITVTVLLCIFAKNMQEKTFRKFVFWCWIVVLVLEIYKQVFYATLEVNGEQLNWIYKWGNFPFQLCSTPLYLLPFVAFMKDGKVRDSIISFLCTFAMFGGLVVFLYPNDVFVSMIGINIQTMVHHGLQIVLGIFMLVYYRKKLDWKFFLKGIIVFGIAILTALLLNTVVYNTISHDFNMFYIGPYIKCHLPILSDVWTKVPYIVFLLIYVLGFILAAAIMFAIPYYLIKLIKKQKNKKQPKEA